LIVYLLRPVADACSAALEGEDEILISAGTVAEALIVSARRRVARPAGVGPDPEDVS